MNTTRLLCFVLLVCSQGCKHQIASSEQDRDLQCDRLVNQMIIAGRDFTAALNSVRDVETARASAEKIQGCADRLNAISGEFALLGTLSPALRARQLRKLDKEDRQQSAETRTNLRVLTAEEEKIVTPAADLFFEKWGEVCTKSGLEYTPEEYRKSRAQPDGPASRSQPIRAETNRTSATAGSGR